MNRDKARKHNGRPSLGPVPLLGQPSPAQAEHDIAFFLHPIKLPGEAQEYRHAFVRAFTAIAPDSPVVVGAVCEVPAKGVNVPIFVPLHNILFTMAERMVHNGEALNPR